MRRAPAQEGDFDGDVRLMLTFTCRIWTASAGAEVGNVGRSNNVGGIHRKEAE